MLDMSQMTSVFVYLFKVVGIVNYTVIGFLLIASTYYALFPSNKYFSDKSLVANVVAVTVGISLLAQEGLVVTYTNIITVLGIAAVGLYIISDHLNLETFFWADMTLFAVFVITTHRNLNKLEEALEIA
jgi:hypothetical protein